MCVFFTQGNSVPEQWDESPEVNPHHSGCVLKFESSKSGIKR